MNKISKISCASVTVNVETLKLTFSSNEITLIVHCPFSSLFYDRSEIYQSLFCCVHVNYVKLFEFFKLVHWTYGVHHPMKMRDFSFTTSVLVSKTPYSKFYTNRQGRPDSIEDTRKIDWHNNLLQMNQCDKVQILKFGYKWLILTKSIYCCFTTHYGCNLNENGW